MKRPVWRYAQEATTNAPFEVVRNKLAALESAYSLSVCSPRLGGAGTKAWCQNSFGPVSEIEGAAARKWTAQLGSLQEEASLTVRVVEGRCLLHVEGKLKGWPLLWKVGLFGWRSEGLLQRFVGSL